VHLHAFLVPNSSPRVATSILNWNGVQETRGCLESVRTLDYPRYLTDHHGHQLLERFGGKDQGTSQKRPFALGNVRKLGSFGGIDKERI
jgi:hypothetical protein